MPHTTSRASFWTQATWWFFIPTELATRRARTAHFLGSAGLIKLVQDNHHLPANGIADYILGEADRFSGGKHPADDRTLVVLKVNEEEPGLLSRKIEIFG